MNPHFRPPDDSLPPPSFPPSLPMKGYGLIDQLELIHDGGGGMLLMIDIMDAAWLRQKSSKTWRSLIHKSLSLAEERRDFPYAKNPFDNAPLFMLEVESSTGTPIFELSPVPRPTDAGYSLAVARLERMWIDLEILPPDAAQGEDALLYSNLFSEPIKVKVRGKPAAPNISSKLAEIFDLSFFPKISLLDLEKLLRAKCRPDYLAAYDVGQGNANALLGRIEEKPSLYYDLGAGVYRNHHTRPHGLRFCFDTRHTIILSHWDSDHWAGACASSYPGPHHPLNADWIVPLQVVTAKHAIFAYTIVQAGGSVRTYSPAPGSIARTKAGKTTIAKLGVGMGPDKNSSGLVLVIERRVWPLGVGSWILAGDCDYGYFPPALAPEPPVAIVVPHHGASAHTSTIPPNPTPAYSRLIYSFGRNNRHGRTNVSHPTSATVNAHASAGWSHGNWQLSAPGYPLPGGATLATCEHPPGIQRGGALVGWWSRPPLITCNCVIGCNAPLTQN